jgi:hypothetical protein
MGDTGKSALQKLAAQLTTMASPLNPDDQPEAFELRILAKRIEAQAEIIERGLGE